MRQSETEKTEFLAKLSKFLKPGDTVYTVLRHVSKSGMMRAIDCYVMPREKNGDPMRITYWVCKVTETPYNRKHEAARLDGCGMDMGFELVYRLGYAMFPQGFGRTGTLNGRKVTPKTEAEAAKLVAAGAKFSGRNGDESGWDKDGGYALRQGWM